MPPSLFPAPAPEAAATAQQVALNYYPGGELLVAHWHDQPWVFITTSPPKTFRSAVSQALLEAYPHRDIPVLDRHGRPTLDRAGKYHDPHLRVVPLFVAQAISWSDDEDSARIIYGGDCRAQVGPRMATPTPTHHDVATYLATLWGHCVHHALDQDDRDPQLAATIATLLTHGGLEALTRFATSDAPAALATLDRDTPPWPVLRDLLETTTAAYVAAHT